MNHHPPRSAVRPDGPDGGTRGVETRDRSASIGAGGEAGGASGTRSREEDGSVRAGPGEGAHDEGPEAGGRATGDGWSFRWALAGVALVLGVAVVRLGARAIEALRSGLSGLEWAALLLLTGLFVYGEGIRALERRWVPFVAQRARNLSSRSLPWRLLGPLYAMGLVGPRIRFVVRAWSGVTAVVVAVLLVHALPEPWRGIVDFAVAAALLWGVVALLRALATDQGVGGETDRVEAEEHADVGGRSPGVRSV